MDNSGQSNFNWGLYPDHSTNVSVFSCCFFFLTKKVAFADHLTVAGKLADIKHLRDKLAMVSLKYYGHSLKTTKLYLIVKKMQRPCLLIPTKISQPKVNRRLRVVFGSDA